MNILLIIISFLHICNDCIYYKKPNIVYNIYKHSEIGFCMYHKDYATLSIHNENKCGINKKNFSPKFCKINQKNYPHNHDNYYN
jgi:hypothetical protein